MRRTNLSVLGFSETKVVVNLWVTANKEWWVKKEEIPVPSLGKRSLV